MDIKSAFPSKYVAASDLQGQDVTLAITAVLMEAVQGEPAPLPMVKFAGMSKGMILNKTNANTIAGLYGNETDRWIGQAITVYPTHTEYGGQTVDCIRVRSTPPISAPTAAPQNPAQPPPLPPAAFSTAAPAPTQGNPVTF